MSWTVTVYFDDIEVDETHFFEKEGDAAKCASQLKIKHRGNSLYKVEVKKVHV